jgi:hypothetical protein
VKQAALGFRAHSGWTALVALAVTRGSPTVLLRERIHLVETFTYRFRQPYHTAKSLSREQAPAFISKLQAQARELAVNAIEQTQAQLKAQGSDLKRCGLLLASGRPLPDLDRILASHSLIHTADGEFFREAILEASSRCGLEATKIKERDVLDSASATLHLKPAEITRRIAELGRPLGPPWSQDEKLASMAAWMALVSPTQRTPPKFAAAESEKEHQRAEDSPVTFESVRELALSLDQVEEGTSYGTPAFKVRGALFVRLHPDFDSTIVVRTDFEQREELLAADPETYFITDHYRNYEWVLVRLSHVRREVLRDLLRTARRLASTNRRRSSRD